MEFLCSILLLSAPTSISPDNPDAEVQKPISPPVQELVVKKQAPVRPFVEASFLYWGVTEDGTDVAVSGTEDGFISGIVTQGSDEAFDLGAGVGFRVALGCTSPKGDLQGRINYTWLNSNNTRSFTPSTGALFPVLMNPAMASATYARRSEGSWNVGFQSLDLLFVQEASVHPLLSLSPLIGLKAVWITQDLDYAYLGFNGQTVGGGSITNGTYRIVGTCHFSGVGLEAGIGSGWTFSSAWHLFSHLEGALLMGRFRGHEEHTVQQQIAYDNGSHLSRAVPNLTFDLGLSWNRSLRSLLFNAQIAYEASCFFSQNQFTHLTTGVPVYVRTPGILALQGLTLSFSLRF